MTPLAVIAATAGATDISLLEASFRWAVSQEVTGILQWLGTVIAVLGIPVAVIQSWRAAASADAAKQAVDRFQWRVLSTNVSHSYSQLEFAKTLVASGQFLTASAVVGSIKRSALQAALSLEAVDPTMSSIQQARRNLVKVESQLALAIRSAGNFKPTLLDGAIRGLGECLIEWEQYLVIKAGK